MLIKSQNKNGFTLVELLVVISIIGVLSAILTANFMGMRERARDAQKIQNLNSIKNALRMYYNDNQSYPSGSSCNTCLGGGVLDKYLTSIGATEYIYTQLDNGDGFKLTVNLEAGAGDDDRNSQTKCGELNTIDKVFEVCAN